MAVDFYILSVIGVMIVATFFCRASSFYIFKNYAEHPVARYLGLYLPAVIMMLLVLYTLTDVDYTVSPFGLNEILASATVVILHLLWRNALLSIGVSTGLYMFLIQSAMLRF